MGMIYIPTLVMGMTNQRPMSKKNRNDDAGDPSWTMMDDWWDDVSSIISIQGFQRRFFYALVIYVYIYTYLYIYMCIYIYIRWYPHRDPHLIDDFQKTAIMWLGKLSVAPNRSLHSPPDNRLGTTQSSLVDHHFQSFSHNHPKIIQNHPKILQDQPEILQNQPEILQNPPKLLKQIIPILAIISSNFPIVSRP